MKKTCSIFLCATLMLCFGKFAVAHCEVPCGIYDDKARVQAIHEHSGTILKAMNEIKRLQAAKEDKNYNQIVRWIHTKDEHAEAVQDIVYQYFMTQRIKPKDQGEAQTKYLHELTLLHQMLIEAMKSKQTLNTAHPAAMDAALHAFSESYFTVEAKGSK